MTVRIGPYEFDDVHYDHEGDVLYLSVGKPRPDAITLSTPEGHAVRFDEHNAVIGITVVNAKWLLERDGKLVITVPSLIVAAAEDIAPALTAAL